MAKTKNVQKKKGLTNPSEVEKVLGKLRKKSEEEEASCYAKELSLPYLDLNIFPIDQEHIVDVTEENSRKYNLAVIYKVEKELKVGTTTPEDKGTLAFLKKIEQSQGVTIKLFVVSKSSLERAWSEYKKIKMVNVFDYLRMGLSGEDLENFEKELKDLINLEQRIKELPVTQVLNLMIAGAVKTDASDIHMEPQKNGRVRLRYRIDGVLQTVAKFPITIYPTIISRIKVLGGMMINVRDIAQDGRFSIAQDENKRSDMDVRVSILPGNFGENIVIRLLNQEIEKVTVNKLGLTGKNYDELVVQSEKKQGMIIDSGPTGSGKTTTLYAIINKLNSPDIKIISIEDPVEYQVNGVNQTQVEAERGYDFENGLRAIVRQDPDIILVGEIRDDATAEIAVHAALTGHLVLTTVHANSAAGVIGRLVDLGVKPTLIAPAMNAFIAQRLVRKLCPHCKEKYKPAQETIDTLKKMLSLISPKAKVEVPTDIENLWRSKGCTKCHGLGYKGRIGIFEVLAMNEKLQELVEGLATEDDIRMQALEEGMIAMEQDGILKAIEGETSLEELQRVVGKGEYLMHMYEKIVIQSLSRGMTIDTETMEKIVALKGDFRKLKDELKDISPSILIKYIFSGAIHMKAGDVHIEPGEKEFKVRFRIDGTLHEIMKFPMSEFLSVLNEIKSLSGFKTESRVGVIDGRFRIITPEVEKEIKGGTVDVRVSVILGGFGDIIVMRFLNQSAQATELKKICLNPYNLEILKRNISKPNGIILNTGPTGSGKTTTLYSALAHLNKPELKIITVEDPIEYQMDGVLQTQVNEKEKYTFASAMRALLRQNPDIMMIGEIRDQDTAKIAYQAALTGHLVLSTLHTNSAAGSMQRLVNMGLSLSDLAAGTNCFMAQRLVRVLCPDCKKKRKAKADEKETMEKILNNISPKTGIKTPKNVEEIFEPVGCPKCNMLGYVGRVPIAEMFEVSTELQKFIISGPTTTELKNKAVEAGMLTMAQDGVLRVLEGVTSLNEVARMTREVEADA
ncbi:MAG: GspE/PulE family protein [Patescibacteria group bacterium]|nr:GspE/PulE family protein [Patescibacteria group bacterium]